MIIVNSVYRYFIFFLILKGIKNVFYGFLKVLWVLGIVFVVFFGDISFGKGCLRKR